MVSVDRLIDERLDVGRRAGSGGACHLPSLGEHGERRNGAYAEPLAEIGKGLGVDFYDEDTSGLPRLPPIHGIVGEHHLLRSGQHGSLQLRALVRAGWRVLRFTWAMIVDHSEIVVQEIRFALRSDRSNG